MFDKFCHILGNTIDALELENLFMYNLMLQYQLRSYIQQSKFHMDQQIENANEINKLIEQLCNNYIIQEKPLYGAEYLLPFLEAGKLKQLEKKFQKSNDQVSALEFVQICGEFLHFPSSQKQEFIHGLLKFFKDIDMDDSNSLSWSQFTQYLIDNFESTNHYKNETHKLKLQSNYILNKVHEHQEKHYILSTRYVDKLTHSNNVIKLRQDNKRRIIMQEYKSNKIKMINFDRQQRQVRSDMIPDKIYIVNFEYSARQNKICMLASNMNFYFAQLTAQFSKVCHFYFDIIQINVWYANQAGVWLTSGLDNIIHIWKFNKYNQEEIQQNLKAQGFTNSHCRSHKISRVLEGHTNVITGVVQMTQPKYFVSCAKDGRIIFWDLENQKYVCDLMSKQLSGRALRGIDYQVTYDHLITYGFESKINIWCPFFSFSKPFVKALDGHYNSVLCAKFIRDTPYLASVDQKNSIRIWDIRFYSLIQLINCDTVNINQILFLNQDLFAVAGKRILYYDNTSNRKLKSQFDTDIYPCEIFYSDAYEVLVVITKFDTRFYDGKNGSLKSVLKGLHQQSRFYFMSNNNKKLFTLNENRIEQYQLQHFNKIDNTPDNIYEKYEIQPKYLNECKYQLLEQYRLLIVADAMGKINYIHFSIEGKILIKTLIGGHRQFPLAGVCNFENYLWTASKNGIVTCWDLATGKYIKHFELENETVQEMYSIPNKKYLAIKTLDSLYFCGKHLLKLNGKCFEVFNDKLYITDKSQILVYAIKQIQGLIGQLNLVLVPIEVQYMYRREQIDATKHLIETKKKHLAKHSLNPVTIIYAHSEQITQMKYCYNQNGLISGSMDKTIKVWKIEGWNLKCVSCLSLVEQFECKWYFSQNIIRKEIKSIIKSLNFIEEYESICFDPSARLEIINRIITKKFGHQKKVKSKVIKKISRKDSKEIDFEDKYAKQLKEITESIKEDERKKQLRDKINRLKKESIELKPETNNFMAMNSPKAQNVNQPKTQILNSLAKKYHNKIYRPVSSNLHKNKSFCSLYNQELRRQCEQQITRYNSKDILSKKTSINSRPSTAIRRIVDDHSIKKLTVK